MIAAAAIPRPPALPASLAALVLLAGVGLLYWSLTGLGLLTTGSGGSGGGMVKGGVLPKSSGGTPTGTSGTGSLA